MFIQIQAIVWRSLAIVLASVFLLTALLLTGCGASLDSYKAQERGAPKNAGDLGVLVVGGVKTEIADLLEKHPEARYRVVDSKRGLYEIFNLDSSTVDLKGKISGEILENAWLSRESDESQLTPLKPVDTLAPGSEPGGEDLLEPCVRDSQRPTAKIKILSPSQGLDGPLEVGLQISLEGEATAHPDHPSELRKAFAVVGPEDSHQSTLTQMNDSFSFTVEAMGIYQILFIVQDSRNVCEAKEIVIFASGNRSFVGNDIDVEEELSQLRLEDFSHLQEIQAHEAWSHSQGQNITIAVLDSGVNYNHPALVKNILTNLGEIPDNGIDDDQNGLIDDYVGYDFVNADPYPYDDEGHGSHVAGLAASSVFGVAKKSKILPIKAIGPKGGDIATIGTAVRYAVDRGAHVLNMSFGSYGGAHPEFVRSMNYAEAKGVLVVAAAGNGHPFFGTGLNNDISPNFPASFPHENIVSVAAKSKGHVLAPYSNYGINTTDIAAPGGLEPDDMLLSCYRDNPTQKNYIGYAGTSMATPLVSGVAALVWSLRPEISASDLRRLLMESGEVRPELTRLIQSGRYINAKTAVEKALEL